MDIKRSKSNKVFFVIGFCRFIARPCALGLKIQANGPQKAQHNAILEKVFTAITKVKTMFLTTVKEDLLLWEGKKKKKHYNTLLFERFSAFINGCDCSLIT